eukprot:1052603-Prymnesium_polylepis.1
MARVTVMWQEVFDRARAAPTRLAQPVSTLATRARQATVARARARPPHRRPAHARTDTRAEWH